MLNNTFWKNLLKALLILGMISSSVYTLTAQAAGVVTKCSDDGPGPGTLKTAIIGGGDVTFDCSGTIVVEPEIRIEGSVPLTRIDASGQNVTLSGNNTNAVFWVWDTRELELINLTITQGAVYGGVRNLGGTVTITDSVITGNSSATSGGGINNIFFGTDPRMTLISSTVSDNTAPYYGGGIDFNCSFGDGQALPFTRK
jgi:hypothetical protein